MVHFAIVCLIEQLLEFGKKLSNFLAQHAMLFKCRIVLYSTSKLNPALKKKSILVFSGSESFDEIMLHSSYRKHFV